MNTNCAGTFFSPLFYCYYSTFINYFVLFFYIIYVFRENSTFFYFIIPFLLIIIIIIPLNHIIRTKIMKRLETFFNCKLKFLYKKRRKRILCWNAFYIILKYILKLYIEDFIKDNFYMRSMFIFKKGTFCMIYFYLNMQQREKKRKISSEKRSW